MKSHVAVFDTSTGTSETVLVHDGHIEAPNFTRVVLRCWSMAAAGSIGCRWMRRPCMRSTPALR